MCLEHGDFPDANAVTLPGIANVNLYLRQHNLMHRNHSIAFVACGANVRENCDSFGENRGCGRINRGVEVTYTNWCSFRNAVLTAADRGEAFGSWTLGECK